MPRITLASYSIRVREKNAHTTLDLSDAKAAGLFVFFENYFNGLAKSPTTNAARKKVIGLKSTFSTTSEISGILETGEYGYESNLVDTKGKKKPYLRSTDEAEMLPFYFHLYLPKSGECGILILQRFGVYGVRSILTEGFDPAFDAKFPTLTLNIWPQVPDGVLKNILGKGSLRAITLRKSFIGPDICNALGEDPKSDPAKIDIVISSKKGHTFGAVFGKVRNIFNGAIAGSLNEVVEIKDFKHERTLIEVEIGERRQTVDLTNLNKLRAHIDVTNKVKYGANGHPTLESIRDEASILLKGLKSMLKI